MQCLKFAANRERALREGMEIRRLNIAVDRQDYVVNWTQREDKRNVVLHAVGSADNESGYVFGMHPNFDPALDRDAVRPAPPRKLSAVLERRVPPRAERPADRRRTAYPVRRAADCRALRRDRPTKNRAARTR